MSRVARFLTIAIVGSASLAMTPAASTREPGAFLPYAKVAINDPTGSTAGSSEVGTETVTPRTYGCDKKAYADSKRADEDEKIRLLASATLTVDTRTEYGTTEATKVPDVAQPPGDGAPPQTPYWYDAAHYGVYTCGWVQAGQPYTVVVKGKYRYDQSSAIGDFGWADAECATGYPEGPKGDRARFVSPRYLQKPADTLVGTTRAVFRCREKNTAGGETPLDSLAMEAIPTSQLLNAWSSPATLCWGQG